MKPWLGNMTAHVMLCTRFFILQSAVHIFKDQVSSIKVLRDTVTGISPRYICGAPPLDYTKNVRVHLN